MYRSARQSPVWSLLYTGHIFILLVVRLQSHHQHCTIMLMMSYIIVTEVTVTHKTDSDTISCHSCFRAISWKNFNSRQTRVKLIQFDTRINLTQCCKSYLATLYKKWLSTTANYQVKNVRIMQIYFVVIRVGWLEMMLMLMMMLCYINVHWKAGSVPKLAKPVLQFDGIIVSHLQHQEVYWFNVILFPTAP